MARWNERLPNRWWPVAAFLGIGIGVALAVLVALKPVDPSSPFGRGSCGDNALSIVVNGEGAHDTTRGADGKPKTAPTTCYRAAERDALLAALVLVLPFALVIGFAVAGRRESRAGRLRRPR